MRTRDDDRGAIAILVALFAVAMFVVAALVVDLGMARDTRQDSQNAADASALAAANVLYPDSKICTDGTASPCIKDAVAAAKSYAVVNYAVTTTEWTTCPAAPTGFTVPPGAPTCIAFDSLTKPTKVWAIMPIRDVKTNLGALAGVRQFPVGSRAAARVDAGIQTKCALCFMGSVDTKKFKATVEGGGIAINGYVDLHPGGVPWTASSIAYLQGQTFSGPNASVTPTTTPALADPLAGDARLTALNTAAAALPKYPNAADHPCTKGPGVYGAREFGSNCTLAAGLYVFVGDVTSKNKTITATAGVTIYAMCGTVAAPVPCSGANVTNLDFKNADLNLVAPTTGAYKGLGIVMGANNAGFLSLQGNGVSNVNGAIYAPASNLDYNGTSDVIVTGGPVILKSMTGNGTTGIVIKTASDQIVNEQPGDIGLDQ